MPRIVLLKIWYQCVDRGTGNLKGDVIPNYRGHCMGNFLVGLPMTYVGLYQQTYFRSELITVSALSFAVSTVFLSPDLDLAHSRVTKNWGPLRFVWRGYSHLFSHRGWSHSILFSGLTRVAYLALILLAVLGLTCVGYEFWIFHDIGKAMSHTMNKGAHITSQIWSNFRHHPDLYASIFLGIMMADLLHIVFDRGSTLFLVMSGRRRY